MLGDEPIDLSRLKKQAQLSRTRIPKHPRITRTLTTLQSVLKVLEEHSRTSKSHIDQLIQEVEQEKHQFTRVNVLSIDLSSRRKSPFSNCTNVKWPIWSCKRTRPRCRAWKTRTAATPRCSTELERCSTPIDRQLAKAIPSIGWDSAWKNARRSVTPISFPSNVARFRRCVRSKLNWNRCWAPSSWTSRRSVGSRDSVRGTSTSCCFATGNRSGRAEVEFPSISRANSSGPDVDFLWKRSSAICSFWRSAKWNYSAWRWKASEANASKWITSTRSTRNGWASTPIRVEQWSYSFSFTGSEFFSSLIFILSDLVLFSLYDQVDTKFTFYNPNRSYTDVTRTWSMFVGNTTLLRTVTDVVSPVEIPPRHSPLSFSDEISSLEESDSTCDLDLLLEQVRTSLDDLRCARLDELLAELDGRVRGEIEQVLNDFNFLPNVDDGGGEEEEEEEENSKTIDSGFEGEHRTWNFFFTDILHRVLLLLEYIHTRSKSDDQLVLTRLDEQCEQLAMALSWKDQRISDVQQGTSTDGWKRNSGTSSSLGSMPSGDRRVLAVDLDLSSSLRTLSRGNDHLVPLYPRSEIGNERRSAKISRSRARRVSLGQSLLFALRKPGGRSTEISQSDSSVVSLEESRSDARTRSRTTSVLDVRCSNVVLLLLLVTLQEKFSSLISDAQWEQIGLLLNRRTLNNEKILDRLLKESDLNLPGWKRSLRLPSELLRLDEFLALLLPPIRQELIVHLRRVLSIPPADLAQRLQLHKLIFHLQQLDSL